MKRKQSSDSTEKLEGRERSAFRWLVLWVRPRFEMKVLRHLDSNAISSFFPTRQEMRQWSDRRKLITTPLFPGYIFVYVDERMRITALETEGALKYVAFGGRVAEVDEQTIASLRLAVQRPRDIRVEDEALAPGTAVVVLRGPMAGLRGTLLEVRGSTRVAIQVEAIHQAVSVEVPYADIKPDVEA